MGEKQPPTKKPCIKREAAYVLHSSSVQGGGGVSGIETVSDEQ